jgi:hypothetical protein
MRRLCDTDLAIWLVSLTIFLNRQYSGAELLVTDGAKKTTVVFAQRRNFSIENCVCYSLLKSHSFPKQEAFSDEVRIHSRLLN